MPPAQRLNRWSDQILGAAIEVHKGLGPGLLESAYEACLVFELAERGLEVARQQELPVRFKGVTLDVGYRMDLLVEKSIVVEVKAIDRLAPIHSAQLISYLKLSGCSLRLLINFHVRRLTKGIRRIVNELPE